MQNVGKVIDKKTQKVEINPGIPYVSTSHDAVFELRNIEKGRVHGRSISRFIEIPKSDAAVEEGEPIPAKIRPEMRPWQIKNIYKVVDKQDIASDDEDEDALIFAP